MNIKIEGIVEYIGDTIQVGSNGFSKRELVVILDYNTNYPQSVLVEFNKERCSDLDVINIGSTVLVECNLRGRKWTSPQGEVRYFNTIQAWKITAAINEPQLQNQYNQTTSVNQFPPTPGYSEEDNSDLPF